MAALGVRGGFDHLDAYAVVADVQRSAVGPDCDGSGVAVIPIERRAWSYGRCSRCRAPDFGATTSLTRFRVH
jgi:hypothetical protein